jgi:hypothetical protein
MVAHVVISVILEAKIGGSWFGARLGERLVRLYLNKQGGCGGSHL